MKRRNRNRRPVSKTPSFFSMSKRQGLALRAVPLLLAGLLALGLTPRVEAVTITTGPNPIDTTISKDGTTSFVLNSGNATLSVIDVETDSVTTTISLNQPVNVCRDCDWSEPTQNVLVGCTNGSVLLVDPVAGSASVLLNNPAANYGVLCADNSSPLTVGWGLDANTSSLDQFFPGGTWAPTAPLPIGTPVEMVEMFTDPANPQPEDGFLVAVGSGALGTLIDAFDRATFQPKGASACTGCPYCTPQGLTTAPGNALVPTTNPNNLGALLVVSTSPWGVYRHLANFNYPAVDVSTVGDYVSVLVASPDVDLHIYDTGDPGNIISVGVLTLEQGVEPSGALSTGFGGGSSGGAVGSSLDDLYVVCATASSNSAISASTSDHMDDYVFTPAVDQTDDFGQGTDASETVIQATVCGPCPPDTLGRGAVESASPTGATYVSVYYASGEEVYTLPLASVPGVGLDLDLTLTYRSRRDYDGRYGQSWHFNHDVKLESQPNGDLTYHNGFGRLDTYTYLPGGMYAPPIHYDTSLVAGGATTTISTRFGTVSTFDGQGRRTQVQDRYGNIIQYGWTGYRLDSITDTLGRTWNLAYSSTGRLSSLTDFGGRTWSFTYDYMGNLRSMTTPTTTSFPQGRTSRFSYSANHVQRRHRSNLLHAWSPEGDRVQSLRYDSEDRVVRETLGPSSYAITYQAQPRLTSVVDRSGNTTEWTFGAYAMPVRVETYTKGLRTGEPTSFVTTYAVNATTGLIDHVVFPRGNRADYTYDASLNLTEVRRREADTSTNSSTDIVHGFQYGVFGQRSQSTDPLGRVTSYTLDGFGNTTQVTHPTVTSPASQTITESFSYDGRGRITLATDGEGRSVSFSYHTSGSQSGYLQSIVRDPTPGLNLTTTFGYSQYGSVTSIQDPRGNTTQVAVDTEDYVTEVQAPSPLGYRRRISYDANRRVTKIETENIDRKGVQDTTTPWIETSLTYDVLGRLIEREVDLTPTATATTEYEYDGSGNLVKVTHPESNIDEFTWDERHLLFEATRGSGSPDETTVTFDYGLNGSLVKATDGRSNATAFEHDLFDRRTKTINALLNYVQVTYDKNGNRTLVDAYDSAQILQARTTRFFDEVNRLWKVRRDRFGPTLATTYPTTIFTRDRGHLLTQVQDPLSNSTTFAHDTAGRRTAVTDAVGNSRGFTLDANGNVTRVSDTQVPASGPSETFVTEFDYDVLNRRVERREIDRLNAQNVLSTTYERDSRNNLTFRTDAEGHPVRWTYDLASRLTRYERALQVGAQIDTFLQSIDEVFAYDANHRLTTLTDDNFNSTVYTYDALSRTTRTTYADSKFVQYSHDDASNLSGWTDQNGTVVANTHDAVNRLTARSVTRGTGVLGTTSESFTYDALNRMLTAVDDDYQVEFLYDSVGNLLSDKQGYAVVGQERWKTVSTSYTDAGSMSTIAYPSTFQVSHTRDALYRMTAMVDASGPTNIATFTWQGAARLATTSNQNGTGTDYVYDGFRRTASIDHTLVGGGSLHKFEYAYDKVHGRRMEKNTFSATWIATLPAAVQTFLGGRNNKGDVYAYDMAYRLVDTRYDVTNPLTEVQNPGTQAFVKRVLYTIDGLGNRSQVQTTPPTPPTQMLYANDVVNQYTTVGGVTRSHDNNGSLSDDGTYKFGYDFGNQLVELRKSTTNALIASYRYDALGRRVEKAVVGGATTRYVLDGVQVVEEYDGSNLWQARYVYEDGIDQPRCMDRADIADVNGNSNTTEVLRFHYHQQALGSVTELTQPSGAVVEWVTYDVYGLPTIRNLVGTTVSQSAVGNPWLYTGREYDPESGLFFYRARTYDPGTGRFLQRDPLGFVDGLGLCEYCQSSPTTSHDPMGLDNYRVAPRIVRYDQAEPSEVPEGKTKGDVDRERAEAAIDAHNVKYPEGHPDHIDDGEKADVLSRIGRPAGNGSFANATTLRCTDISRAYLADGRVVYVPHWARRPIVVLPDDRSRDIHERGHVEVTQDEIDRMTEEQERSGTDVSDLDRDERQPERDAVREEFNRRVDEEQGDYDTETDNGKDKEAQKEWHRRRR